MTVPQKKPQDKTIISLETGSFKQLDKVKNNLAEKNPAVPDKETAVAVAVAIFNSMEKPKNVVNFIPQKIFFDNNKEIWIVIFYNSNPAKKSQKGKIYIAIHKSNCEVEKIWLE